jgi:hypothetical protein
MSASSLPKHTDAYLGNCHCGAFKFHVHLPELSTIPLVSCSCSICHRKGYLQICLERKDVVVERDELGLVSYQFGDSVVSHKVRALKGNEWNQPCHLTFWTSSARDVALE